MRVSVKWMWTFGKIIADYPFVYYTKNLEILLQPIAKYYVVAALLMSTLICMFGSVLDSFFGLAAPSLELYFA